MEEMRLIVLAAGVDPHALLKSERTLLTCADGEFTIAKAVLLGIKWFNNYTRKGLKKGDADVELLDFKVEVVEDWALLRCGIAPKNSVTRAHYKALKRLADYVGDGEVMIALCWSRQLHKALLCEVDAAGIERRLRRLENKGKAYQPLVASILDSDRADYHKAIVRRIGEVNEGWEGNLLESAKLGITAACYEWARKKIEEKGDRKQALAFLEKAVKRGYPGAKALKTHTVQRGLEREVALEKLATSGCPYAQFLSRPLQDRSGRGGDRGVLYVRFGV